MTKLNTAVHFQMQHKSFINLHKVQTPPKAWPELSQVLLKTLLSKESGDRSHLGTDSGLCLTEPLLLSVTFTVTQ